ncbi:helix-turn-helix domain-containing protein [Halovivax gelatinilyticus]|uniref:helix-turn-helix domain-containing protein n=1 Tax=Halovivax gelatinilyticus TaxID=2961597 RepID=UPI0020CA6751|nr:helix-turn-helix domain-containing protein [Halovivax gelatinilyticus]
MSLIAEYELENPILADARAGVPDVEYDVVDEFVSDDGTSIITAWATGSEPSLERFDESIQTDPTVSNACRLANVDGRRLYRVELASDAERGLTYPVAVELGITFLRISATGETVRYRARVPDRETLVRYRDVCEDRDLEFTLVGLYRDGAMDEADGALTSRQKEVLRVAFEAGYFAVPRRTTLSSLAESFDVSEQALSATLRRGTANLLAETIASDLEPTGSTSEA